MSKFWYQTIAVAPIKTRTPHLLTLSGALNFGFISGPIFPLLFLVHDWRLLLIKLPSQVTLGSMIDTVHAAIVPIPLALGSIGIIIISLSLPSLFLFFAGIGCPSI